MRLAAAVLLVAIGQAADDKVREAVLAARDGLSRMRDILAAMRQEARFASGDLREVSLAGRNGLGLWISSEIAQVHGGALTALEGVRGAIFRLSLPPATAQAATSAA